MRKYLLLTVALLVQVSSIRAQEFTFGTIPDTQNLSESPSNAGKLYDKVGFYHDNKDELNLKFVASLGDMAQWADAGQLQRVRNAYELLNDKNIPYAPCQGNHDPNLTLFNNVFPESEFVGNGVFEENFRGMENAVHLFSEAGMDFVVVVMQSHDPFIVREYGWDQSSVDWANRMLEKYSDRRAIFVTHDFYENRRVVDEVISQHDNLFLAVCGHSCARGGEDRFTTQTPSGNTVQCIMSDYQCRKPIYNNFGLEAIVRYYTFKPAENKVYAYTYDVLNDRPETDANSQFSFDYDMSDASSLNISNVVNSPGSPRDDQRVTISANISSDDNITSAVVNWGSSSGDLDKSVNMTNRRRNKYVAKIRAQSAFSKVYYSVTATDSKGGQRTSAVKSYTVQGSESDLGQLVWQDEFDYEGSPDPNKWDYDVGTNGNGWGNGELQYYTKDRAKNARVENGVLIIEARKENYGGQPYSSARLKSEGKADWKYGRIEARAKLPGGKGTWAAIWMLPTDWNGGNWPDVGEIDIMENVGYDPNRVHGTVHTGAYNHKKKTQVGNSITRNDFQTAFHTYAVQWEENKIDFIMDGEIYHTFSKHGGNAQWPFDKPFYVILNLAVGGEWGGALGVDPTIWPQRMEVDYVRVYDRRYRDLTAAVPGKVEAERYFLAKGVLNEKCSEGGLNVGGLEKDDWMVYKVNVAQAGQYKVEYRVASNVNGKKLKLEQNSGATLLGSVDIPNTGGWQTYQTVSHTVQLNAGVQELGIGVGSGEFNLNYINFTYLKNPPFSARIEAEDHALMQGIRVEPCSEGGQNVGFIDEGDWMVYGTSIPAGSYTVRYRASSLNGGGKIRLEKAGGGAVYKVTDVPKTNGWQTWTTVTDQVTIPENLTRFALSVPAGGYNLNWIEFERNTSSARNQVGVSFAPAKGQASQVLEQSVDVSEVQMYPNTAQQVLTLANLSGAAGIQFINLNGQVVKDVPLLPQDNIMRLDVSALRKGMYLVRITGVNNTVKQMKLLKE